MAKRPNKETQKKYNRMVDFGCVVCQKVYGVYTEPCIHHFTGAGMGLKSTEKYIPLCHTHHQGIEGIHHIGTRNWEKKFGSQQELLNWYESKNET